MTGGVARFLTLNLWGENGPWEARLALVQARLDALAPDVIGLQEVREVPGRVPNQAARWPGARGWHHAFAPTTAWGGGHEGLAIVSRFPIGAQEFRPLPHSTETEGRGILSARLDGEAGGLWVHTDAPVVPRARGAEREAQVQFVDEVLAGTTTATPRVVDGRLQHRPRERRDPLADRAAHAGRPARRLPGCLGGRAPGSPRLHLGARQRLHGEDALAAARPAARLHLRDARAARSARHGPRARRWCSTSPRPAPSGERLFASDHFGVTADVQLLAPAAAGDGERHVPPGARRPIPTSAARAASRASRPGELLGKRAVGYLNLAVNRVRKHKMDLLEDMRVDLRAQAPDHLALTGDLSNIALTSEWRSALAWLDLSGVAPDAISVIPGNHDAYVPEVLATREFERLFAPYQTSDLDRDGEAAYYPFVQIREPLALIGVSSAVATGDLGAWGQIGEAQLARLEAILKAPELRGARRASCWSTTRRSSTRTASTATCATVTAFAAVLARAGAELVLHGHDHAGSARRAGRGRAARRSRSSAPARRRTPAVPSGAPATASTSSATAARSPGPAACTTRRPASSAKRAAKC